MEISAGKGWRKGGEGLSDQLIMLGVHQEKMRSLSVLYSPL